MIKPIQLDSSKVERDIVAQMIINTDYLKKISNVYQSGSLSLPFTNTVADLCVDYFKKYKSAPGKHIQDLYKKILRIDPDQKQLIKDFLLSINNKIQNEDQDFLYQTDFHLKQTIDHLTEIKISRLQEELESLKKVKDFPKIEALLRDFKSIQHEYKPLKDAFSDKDFIEESYKEEEGSILFKLPGELGELVGPIKRGQYYIIQAGTGVGKSWMLAFMGIISKLCGNETLLTPLEMSGNETNLRAQHLLLGQCIYKEKDDIVYVPIWDCLHNQTGQCPYGTGGKISTTKEVTEKINGKMNRETKYFIPGSEKFDEFPNHQVCTRCKDSEFSVSGFDYEMSTWFKAVDAEYATPEKSINYLDALNFETVNSAGLYIDPYSRSELTVENYDTHLHNIKHYENKEITCGIIDYADEMKWPKNLDERTGMNYIHGGLTAIAQKRRIAIISATQENDEGLSFGSRKKMHLVGKCIRLSQPPELQRRGVIKVEDMKQRFGKSKKGKVLYILQCLELGKFSMDTYWDIKKE